MTQGRSLTPFSASQPAGRAILVGALIYAGTGATTALNGASFRMLPDVEHTLLLLVAGIAPLVVVVILLAVNRGRLRDGERGASILGAGVAALILLPLLRLVF